MRHFPTTSRIALPSSRSWSRPRLRTVRLAKSSRGDKYAEQPGAAAAAGRAMGWRSSVGVPITVEGRLWGVLAVISTTDRPLPNDTERRLAEFTELVATAIANAESRKALTKIAEEQAALRRVATLIARGESRSEGLDAVA